MSGKALPFRSSPKLPEAPPQCPEAEPPRFNTGWRKGKAFPLIGGHSPKKVPIHL